MHTLGESVIGAVVRGTLNPSTAARPDADSQRECHDVAEKDAGSALIMVLVMIVIGSLIVIPTMTYAVTVLRANSALSEKSQRLESVKAGLRVALADPIGLYDACGAGGPTTPVNIAAPTVTGIAVSTSCYFIDYEAAQSAQQLRYGLTSTRVGTAPGTELRGKSYVPVDPTSTSEWLTEATIESETDKIWLPNLPTHGLNRRAPEGTQMPTGYPDCTVYFPGTYPDPVLLDGPTYFASGIYYFEDEVRVEGGADVVVGLGSHPGCTSDQEAIFYAETVPGTHNMSGLGGTWVLGDEARIVVTNANSDALSLKFNTRYVAPGDTGDAPSADVSIVSVNGELDTDDVTGIDLFASGIIEVPVSLVGSETPVIATSQDYLPSVHTPKPKAPKAADAPTAQRYVGAASISWTAPLDGGSPITGYVVTASSGDTCATNGATDCVIAGLSNGTPVSFTVVASNVVGDSEISEPSVPVTPGGSNVLAPPDEPDFPTVVPYEGVARVSWAAPADDGGAPITAYTVTASPTGESCVIETISADPTLLECDVEGLDPDLVPGYTFTVVATNAIGSSIPSLPNPVPVIPAVALGTPPPPIVPPAPPAFVPIAVLDIDVTDAASATVDIPGYVAIPQGRFSVVNPNGHDIVIAGGVLAAQLDVADARATGPQTVDIGFLETIVQRKFRIVSSTGVGYETSTAVVQVNQNGAYAVNSWVVQ